MPLSPPLIPCKTCGNKNPDPDFWQVGDVVGPGCDQCGATAKTIEAWNRGEQTEGPEYLV